MANDFSFSQVGYNATLLYGGGKYRANVRVSRLNYNYGVTSTESQARDTRAFYPHRRIQGQFAVTVDCKGYKEFTQLMTWLRAYVAALNVQALSAGTTSMMMDVVVPGRNFLRRGVLTTGIDDHDHVGSNLFSPELVFVALNDPRDALTQLTTAGAQFQPPQADPGVTLDFYPVSSMTYTDSQLYDDQGVWSGAALAAIAHESNPVQNNTGGPGSDTAQTS
jgi:hypothetical protein